MPLEPDSHTDLPGPPFPAAAARPFAELLADAQAGSDRAVAELYRRHNPRLVRYLRTRAGAEGEDLAADTWLSAARGLARFEGDEDGFAGWLFTIARRRLIDHRRAAGRRPASPMSDEVLEDLGRAEPAESAEGALLRTTVADDEARRIVALLPPDQADILLLRVVAGFDVETVAAIVGRRPGTVRVIQHRALRRLARLLDAEPGPEVPAGPEGPSVGEV